MTYKTPSSYGTLNSDEKTSTGDETIIRVSSAGHLRVIHACERQSLYIPHNENKSKSRILKLFIFESIIF